MGGFQLGSANPARDGMAAHLRKVTPYAPLLLPCLPVRRKRGAQFRTILVLNSAYAQQAHLVNSI